jgi:opacity protein-like surface antigen
MTVPARSAVWLVALSVAAALAGPAPAALRAESGGAQGLQNPQEATWGVPHLPDDTSAPQLPTVTPKTVEDCKAYSDFIDGLNKRLEADAATRKKLNDLTMKGDVEINGRRAYLSRLDAIDANLKARIAEAQKKEAECTDKFKTAPKGGGPAGGNPPDPKALCKECWPLLDADLALIKAFVALDDKLKPLNADITKLNAKKNRTPDETKTLNADIATRKTVNAEYKALHDRSDQIGASRETCKKVLCEKPAVCPECEAEGKALDDQAAELKKVWEKLVTLIGKEIDASKQAVAGKDADLTLEDVRDDIDVAFTAEKNAKAEYDKLKAKLNTCQKEKCPPKEKKPGDGSFRTVPESGQFYAGFGGGFGFGSSSWQEEPIGTNDFGVSGFLAGGHAGRQVAGGQVPVAVEGDFAMTGFSGDTQSYCNNPCRTSNRWIATARARVSLPVGGSGTASFTPYVTGGVAFGNVRADVSPFPGGQATRAGLTIGGGVEFPFLTHRARAMSARIEFRHLDFGRAAICTPAACGGQAGVSFAANLVTFAISFSLGR